MQHGKTLLAAGLLFSLSSLSAQAALTPETVNGQKLVYDSGNNTTWTQDANLLGTWEGAYQSTSYNTIVNAIIAADPIIHDTPNDYDGSYGNYGSYSGTYNLSASDFGNGGTVDWYAAQAYVNYLNIQNYGGSSQWALPTQPDQNSGYNITNSQLGELYYNELNALAYPGTNGRNYGILHDGSYNTSGNVGSFANAQTYAYWSGTEYSSNPNYAWFFDTYNGNQINLNKVSQLYAWAVSPGQVSAVPVTGAVWLFGSAMLGLLGLKRRGHAG